MTVLTLLIHAGEIIVRHPHRGLDYQTLAADRAAAVGVGGWVEAQWAF